MIFLSPLNLAFVGAAVVPLVLHLLSRSRQMNVRWGAMMFLGEGEPKRSKLRRVRESSVLALRCLAVALVAVAMSRPVSTGRGFWSGLMGSGAPADSPRAAVVLVVDVSGSTSAPAAPGTTRLDAIKETASRVLAALSEGDQVALLTSDGREAGGFTSDRMGLASRIAALRSTPGSLDVAWTMEEAVRMLGVRPGVGMGSETTGRGRWGRVRENRVIAVVTDRQDSSFAGLTGSFARRMGESSREAGVSRVVVLTVADSDRDNAWVKSVEVGSGPVLRGRGVEVRVTVRNDGTTPRTGFPVRLMAPGVPTVKGTVDLAPDAEAVWRGTMTFPVAGRVVLSAESGPAGPEFDDRYDRVVEVSESLGVLVVSGGGVGAGTAGAGVSEGVGGEEGLERVPAGLAIAPFDGPGSGGGNSMEVRLASPGKLPLYTLDEFDVVVIPQLSRLDEGEATALVQFVYGGGGLLVGVGPLTDVETLRRLETLLPARVEGATDSGRPPARVYAAGVHPVTGYAVGAEGVLPGSAIQRQRELRVRAGVEAKVVLESVIEGVGEGGRMALMVEGRYGKGRVLLTGAPLEASWSDMVRSAGFVPLMQGATRYVAGQASGELEETTGRVIGVMLPGDADARSVSLDGPGGLRVVPEVDRVDRRLLARWSPGGGGGALMPGLYEVRYRAGGRDRVEPVIVRAKESESDLRSSMETIKGAVGLLRSEGGMVGAEVIEPREGDASPIEGVKYGRELWPYLLAGALMALLMEQLLARNWTSRRRI